MFTISNYERMSRENTEEATSYRGLERGDVLTAYHNAKAAVYAQAVIDLRRWVEYSDVTPMTLMQVLKERK